MGKDDKFIMFGLDDERSKDVADVLGNKTCKKIIDYLAENKEASEKDISDALKIPMNTTEYNLNKLIKSGLVEKTKNFFWSIKGKKIDMYKLANKHIVISPKSKPRAEQLRAILPFIAIIAIALVALIFVFPFLNNKDLIKVDQNGKKQEPFPLKQFKSPDELKSFLNASYELTHGTRDSWGLNLMPSAAGVTGAKMATAESASDSSSSAGGGSAESYSKTNVQVEGVDEPDIVKNDGKYIYTLSGGKIAIVEAYPASNMKVLSEIKISNARDIFVNEDKLIVFGEDYSYMPYAKMAAEVMCLGCGGGYSTSRTLVMIYDIKDRNNPILEYNITSEGNYVDSRMIGDYVYLVSSKYANVNYPEPPIYTLNGVEERVPATDVYYFDYHDNSYVFNSITSINVKSGDFNKKVYLIGQASTIYVSQKNIYLTYQKSLDYKDYVKKYSEEVVIKIVPEENVKINEIVNSENPEYMKQNELNSLIYTMSNKLTGDFKAQFDEKFMKLNEDFQILIQKETEKTAVHRIGVNKDEIKYTGAGEVPGHILNQFSMDESNDYFRIATTVGDVWGGKSSNNVYVLDKELKIAGRLEDLAKGEKIYSARFVGNRAYVVTFKKVDPLFVIDLSVAEEPKVLGYLKIPGYSDYLHPYDENHVIGIGKEAVDASEVETSGRNLDFAWYQGVKISLFDVSDVTQPIEEAKYVIGDRGTDSPALYDHKALLFDKEKKLLVIPVSVAEIDRSKYRECSQEELRDYNSYSYCLSANTYGEQVWQGAYVFRIDSSGIELRGKITHVDEKNELIPAKNEVVGTERKDSSGYTWVKIGDDKWKTDALGYQNVYWADAMIDQQPGGINFNIRNYYDYQTQIQRSLFMDDVLYTVSQAKIKANDLDSLAELNRVSLGYSPEAYPIAYY
jgi:inhibitor of cysteine peptidase